MAAAYAKTLMFYAAKSGDVPSRTLAKELLDRMWTNFQDNLGVSLPEVRKDYNRFDDPLFVPPGWSGTTPQGATINSSSTFISIRPKYLQDPSWPKIQAYLNDQNNPNAAPSFTYHRFWAQADIALAMAEYGRLFP